MKHLQKHYLSSGILIHVVIYHLFPTILIISIYSNQRTIVGTLDGILIGDGGYACKRFLMVPYHEPANPHQVQFNNSLCRTRARIEQTFGILKARFQCLKSSRVKPYRAARMTVCCSVLHNIATGRGEVQPPLEEDVMNFNQHDAGWAQEGRMVRDHIANQYF